MDGAWSGKVWLAGLWVWEKGGGGYEKVRGRSLPLEPRRWAIGLSGKAILFLFYFYLKYHVGFHVMRILKKKRLIREMTIICIRMPTQNISSLMLELLGFRI